MRLADSLVALVLLGGCLAPASAAPVERRLEEAGIADPTLLDGLFLQKLELASLNAESGKAPGAAEELEAGLKQAAAAARTYRECSKQRGKGPACGADKLKGLDDVLNREAVHGLRFEAGLVKVPVAGCTEDQRFECSMYCTKVLLCACCQHDGALPKPIRLGKALRDRLSDAGIAQPWALDPGLLRELAELQVRPKAGKTLDSELKPAAGPFASYLKCRAAISSGDGAARSAACGEREVSFMRLAVASSKIQALRKFLGLPEIPRVGCNSDEEFSCTTLKALKPGTDCCREPLGR